MAGAWVTGACSCMGRNAPVVYAEQGSRKRELVFSVGPLGLFAVGPFGPATRVCELGPSLVPNLARNGPRITILWASK